MSDNAIHDAERDEWKSAVRAMTEFERAEFERPTLAELTDMPDDYEEDCE